MKVTKIVAFKSNDDSLWETESEAINDNINQLIDETLHHSCESSDSDIVNDVKAWIKNYPKDVRYILNNIKHAQIQD